MTQALQLAPPVVCRAAGLEKLGGRSLLGEEALEAGTREAVPLAGAAPAAERHVVGAQEMRHKRNLYEYSGG